MAAYRRVYDSRHLHADCEEPGSSSQLPLPFYTFGAVQGKMKQISVTEMFLEFLAIA